MNNKNIQILKELNEIKILNLLKNEAPISRSELAEKTNITKVTISEIIKRLDKEGYILVAGKGESTSKGGKRPTLIKLNPNKGYVIGIEYKRKKAHIAIANIESDIIAKTDFSYQVGTDLHSVIEKTFQKIDNLLESQEIPSEKLISIAIGVPGFIDYEKGELTFADTMKGWEKKPFASRFSKHYNLPVLIENDVNMVAIGEDLVGAGKDESNIVSIWIGAGVGAGIIMDNQLIRGASGIAGEIGYLEIGNFLANHSFLRNLYTNQKYIGDLLSEEHLFDVLKMKMEFKGKSLEKPIGEYNIIELLKLADQGNSNVQEILDEYAMILAIVCTELIKTINTNLIILSGTVIENSKYLFSKVQQFVKSNMRDIPFDASSIVIGELGGDTACLKGALALALQVIYKPYIKHKRLKQVHIRD
ncbi:MAG: ROK family transcriptional regulator [Candidatus Marinimicrobia bacterium]|nr:ROK family transcriptional regulator [Candidatus Neomarinimicrobiota bacterium]